MNRQTCQPAMLFVCLVCVPFAAIWMITPEFKAFRKSLFHSLLMVSNFELWDDVSYFAPKNDMRPLLHTSSLSVDVQFYQIFPPMLWALRARSQRTMSLVVGSTALLSFGRVLLTYSKTIIPIWIFNRRLRQRPVGHKGGQLAARTAKSIHILEDEPLIALEQTKLSSGLVLHKLQLSTNVLPLESGSS